MYTLIAVITLYMLFNSSTERTKSSKNVACFLLWWNSNMSKQWACRTMRDAVTKFRLYTVCRMSTLMASAWSGLDRRTNEPETRWHHPDILHFFSSLKFVAILFHSDGSIYLWWIRSGKRNVILVYVAGCRCFKTSIYSFALVHVWRFILRLGSMCWLLTWI